MTKIKRRNKASKLSEILPMQIIHEFSKSTYEERKNTIKEANEFIKQKNIYGN